MYIWVISIFLVICVCFLFSNTFKENYKKVKTIYEIYKNITTPSPIDETTSQIEENTIRINYNYNQQNYEVRLPFDKYGVMDMLDTQVYAHYENGETKNITQQPGVNYQISPNDIGCVKISVQNLDSGETNYFSGDEKVKI